MIKLAILSAAVLVVVMLSACEYFAKGEALVVDGMGKYCDSGTPTTRELARQSIAPELKAEGLEVCLGCEGDPETYCTGAHRPKVDTSAD